MNNPSSPPDLPRFSARPETQPPDKKHYWPWILAGVVILIGVIAFFTHRQTAGAAGGANGGRFGANGAPVMVSVATAREGDIGVYVTALGVVTPLNMVSVQSRVAGQIMKINYQEGQLVHAGDLLIEIDPGPYQAAVTQAQGQLDRDQALLANARLDLDRYQEAFASNAIPKQQYDTQVATVEQYEGTVRLDQGNLDNANVQLAYCHITAPITGRIGLRLVDVGNIVQASGSNALVIITQLQPISVIFTVAEDDLPQIQKPFRAGHKLAVDLFDRTQQTKLASGTLETLDNEIDPTTGTLKLRAVFTNADETLFPNQFVNVKLLVDTHEDVTLVPINVIQQNSDGAFVYLLTTSTNQPPDTNQTVTVHAVTRVTDDSIECEVDNLDPGAKLAADNFNKLTDGAKVIPRAATGRTGKGRPKSSP